MKERRLPCFGSLLRTVCYKFPRQPLFGNPDAKAKRGQLGRILNTLKTEIATLHINDRIKLKELYQYRGAESKGLSPVHLAVNEKDLSRWGNRSNFNTLETMMQN